MTPLFYHRDAVGDGQRLLLVVRYVNGGDAHLALNVVDHAAHFDAELGIQVGQRFIHEQHLRVG